MIYAIKLNDDQFTGRRMLWWRPATGGGQAPDDGPVRVLMLTTLTHHNDEDSGVATPFKYNNSLQHFPLHYWVVASSR